MEIIMYRPYNAINLNALRIALSILESFKECSLYNEYKEVDEWTDEEYEEMLEELRVITY